MRRLEQVNKQRAKEILMLYRPGTADAQEPECADALEFARQDPDLQRWFEERCTVHEAIRARFKQIAVPEGLKEQILSERRVHTIPMWRRQPVVLAVAASVVLLVSLAALWLRPRAEDSFAIYRGRMAGIASRGYSMDMEANDLVQIHSYLARQQAPANYVLPPGLQKATATGCAVEKWQGAKVAMICFRTGKPLPPGEKSDLWLFVIDRASVKDAPAPGQLRFAKVNKLITATWAQGDKLYLLGTQGDDEQAVRRYL
jgi:uncharacterized membrane protein YbaN (DUF454 family)